MIEFGEDPLEFMNKLIIEFDLSSIVDIEIDYYNVEDGSSGITEPTEFFDEYIMLRILLEVDEDTILTIEAINGTTIDYILTSIEKSYINSCNEEEFMYELTDRSRKDGEKMYHLEVYLVGDGNYWLS